VIADAGGKFTIGGLPAGRYRVERTTAKIFAENAGIVTVGAAGRAAVSVPAAGVVTLFPADD